MRILILVAFILILLKLSLDDARFQLVYQSDLILLNLLGLALFQLKTPGEWVVMVVLIGVSAFLGKGLNAMGEGDVAVILALGLISTLSALVLLIQVALILSLAWVLWKKKASLDPLPFVPFLSVAFVMVYLIRLRLIFS